MSSPSNCCDRPAALTPFDEGLAQLLEQSLTPVKIILVPLREALNSVLAEDIKSAVSVPPADNSAVDGYALNIESFSEKMPLTVSSRIPAGSDPASLIKGTAARIFTGASIPEGANCVVMQEDCQYDAETNKVVINSSVKEGQNIRPAGQDIQIDSIVLKRGTKLSPQCLGLLASIGISTIPVYAKLKVAIFSTGDELVEPGHSLLPGQIYNSNRYLLSGLLQGLNFDIVDLGCVADNLSETESTLVQAASDADIIITTGGASVGEEDHIRAAIEQHGHVNFWRLALKPGKPFMFGAVNNTPVLGLPGNPGAVLVTFLLMARPYLLKSQGHKTYLPEAYYVAADFSTHKTSPRREFIRVQKREQKLQKHTNQSSGMLSSASWADGLAVIKEGQTINAGDQIAFYPFSELLG